MKKNNPIIEILVGIPASGKSTYSKEKVKNDNSYGRVCRDDFRFMIKNQPFCENKIEELISKLMFSSIDALLAKNINVIIDNTNLKEKYINELIKHVEYVADVEFKVFDISLEEAILRDNSREKKVGEDVIKKMYKDYLNLTDTYKFEKITKKHLIYTDPPYNGDLPSIVIFDIDGTLAHMNGKRGPFDWNRVDVDDLDKTVANAFRNHMALGHRIFVVSGRDETSRLKTQGWLSMHGLEYDSLLMRKAGDFRKDSIVKEEIYNLYIKDKYNVTVIYDDRQQVVDMWRSLGLKVFQVEKADF